MNLRWGILGCARISRRGLIPGIQASKTGRLVALASRNPATSRAWRDEFTIVRSHETYQGLLEDPEIDAVYVPLPNELHKPWVNAAAEAGSTSCVRNRWRSMRWRPGKWSSNADHAVCS